MRNAALQPVVLNAGGLHHLLERGVAVSTQRHDLLHIAFKRGVVALAQKLQAPAPLLPVQLGPEQQRRLLVEHPLEGLERRVLVGPGFAVAHGDLRRIGEAGFQCRVGLPVHDRHLVAALQQVPGGAHANNARTQNNDFHTNTFLVPKCEGSCFQLTEKLNYQ